MTRKAGARRGALGAILALFMLHTIMCARLFPTLGAIVERETPVVMVDHGIHEYHGRLGAEFFREHGRTWGYDFFFMAGYPETPVWDSSSNPSILFHLIGGGKDYRAYKVGLSLASILVIGGVAGGAWATGLGAWEAAAAGWLGWFVFWTGFPSALWRSGLFAFVLAAAGVGLLLGLCVRFDRRPSRGGWCALMGAGAGLFFVHVTTPVMAAGGLLAFYAVAAKRHGARWHGAVFGATVLAVLANLFWLAPLWRFRGIRTGSGLFMTTNSAWFLVQYYLAPSIEGRTGLVLFVLGTAGLLAWVRRGLGAASAAFGGAILGMALLTGLGSLWEPTKTLEPLRFRVALHFLLAIPAGSLVVVLTGWLARIVGGGRRGVVVAGLAWALALGGWGALERGFFEASARSLLAYRPMVVGLAPEAKRMVGWLKENTDISARVMFEDQLRLLEATDPESVHWTALLPFLLEPEQRLFIGGLYQTAFIKHHDMAAFGDFKLGDRSINEWSPEDLKTYCDRYNVGWVVCWSPLSRYWFDRFGLAKRVATLPRYSTANRPVSTNEHEWKTMILSSGLEVARRYMSEGEGAYAIYKVDRPHSYFLKGKGRVVSVGPNRVELADLEPEGGAVVLGMHWMDTWKCEENVVLKPEVVEFDPVAFVRMEMGGAMRSVVLFNGYGRQ